jgi:hypothetical protein
MGFFNKTESSFSEEKEAERLLLLVLRHETCAPIEQQTNPKETKVFCFFFQKKCFFKTVNETRCTTISKCNLGVKPKLAPAMPEPVVACPSLALDNNRAIRHLTVPDSTIGRMETFPSIHLLFKPETKKPHRMCNRTILMSARLTWAFSV